MGTSACTLKWYSTCSKRELYLNTSIFNLIPAVLSLTEIPQYENQAHVLGKWGTTGLVGRHKFSNVTGKVKLKRERFLPPRGWDWEDEWFVDPERW